MSKSLSSVEFDGDEVRARMGWAFRSTFPRSAVRAERPFTGIPGGIGVHGFRGRYVVNGAAKGGEHPVRDRTGAAGVDDRSPGEALTALGLARRARALPR